MKMHERAGVAGSWTLRSQSSRISLDLRMITCAYRAGEFIALEGKNDADRFLVWLAKAEGPATKRTCSVKDGVTLKRGNYYITVIMHDRFPASSTRTFKAHADSWIVDAEDFITRAVRCNACCGAKTYTLGQSIIKERQDCSHWE